MSYPLPEPTPLSKPYWDALAQGRLVYQSCRRCKHAWLPARAECPECLEADWEWATASGRGRVVSWVVFHHAYHEAFKSRVPYNVTLVELEEGPRLLTNITNPEHGIEVGRSVSLAIEKEHDFALARFALA
ncbi:MAG: Zn-ribbon domain-containing OB-fold protein [Bacteroidota bacterium]|jgi:uncharacterized OB-fold protein